MSNKYKGLIITFDKEISEEAIQDWQNLFMKIKNVCAVNPLVKNFEDYMSEEKAKRNLYAANKLIELAKFVRTYSDIMLDRTVLSSLSLIIREIIKRQDNPEIALKQFTELLYSGYKLDIPKSPEDECDFMTLDECAKLLSDISGVSEELFGKKG